MPEKKSLLIVESYEMLKALLGDFFRDEEYEVFEACSGEEAMSIATDHHVDVVISAVMGLPGMTGVQFAERIREQNPAIIIFLMSGGMPPEVRVRAESVARKVFDKPFDPFDMQTAVAEAAAS